MRSKYTAAVFCLGTLCVLAAQPALTFEVASIKPATSAGLGRVPAGVQLMPGGGLRASNVTLRLLLTLAYDVRDFQISGGPPWVNTQMYDIQARAGGAPDTPVEPDAMRNLTDEQRKTLQEQMRERLRGLLADRFQLAVHRESKEQQVYLLEVAKGGAKLQEATGPASGRVRMGRGELSGEGVAMEFIVQVLSMQVRRPVLDRTGLKGKYDFKLTFTPDGPQGFGPGPLPAGVEPPPPADPNGPTIYTAVQEQMGLTLKSDKGPVEMIVIDRVEKASEN